MSFLACLNISAIAVGVLPATPLFSFLALGGDIGCAMGTYLIGSLTNFMTLKQSALCAAGFPVLFIIAIMLYAAERRKD